MIGLQGNSLHAGFGARSRMIKLIDFDYSVKTAFIQLILKSEGVSALIPRC